MILFLDFDGVLHPLDTEDELFTSLPLLEAVLREASHVEVVISSAWREHHPLDELRGFFGPDLRPRIIDVTPVGCDTDDLPLEVQAYLRHSECLWWLRQHRPPGTPWLALDDQPGLWGFSCPNLMLIDSSTGLTARDARELRRRLSRR